MQDINENNIFNIHIENNTNDIIKVYSRNIINKNKSDKILYFNPNILICTLRPNTYLYIKNITINKNYGYIDNIYSLGSFSYKVINNDLSIPSLNNNLKDFNIELITNNNIELDKLIIELYDNLYFRVKKIQNQINNYDINSKSTDINKLTSELFIINNNNIYEIHIFNEYHTLGNLITKYVFNLDNNIPLINYKLEHPLRHKIVINIKHSEYKKIISDSIDNIIKDLDLFKITLLNYINK
jgi:DNA-directed RNA polymerase subunit L